VRYFFLTFLLVTLAAPALAVPAISCHCFQDRSFDPQRPDAVDPYLLANGRNSLFAAAFGVEKKEVVKAVMSGTLPEELWVSHYLAQRSGQSVERVGSLRSSNPSWKGVLSPLGAGPEQCGNAFFAAALQGAGSNLLASLAVDAVLMTRLLVPPEEIADLRGAGADDRQTVLAVFLGRKTGRPARILYDEVAGGGSWGAILAATGMEPKGIEGEMRGLLQAAGTRQ
jgi:hypothetical protein